MEWISVEDRLPKENQAVLITDGNNCQDGYAVGFYFYDRFGDCVWYPSERLICSNCFYSLGYKDEPDVMLDCVVKFWCKIPKIKVDTDEMD